MGRNKVTAPLEFHSRIILIVEVVNMHPTLLKRRGDSKTQNKWKGTLTSAVAKSIILTLVWIKLICAPACRGEKKVRKQD